MSKKDVPCPVEALEQEKPKTLMAQLRVFWPQVERALGAGHSLRLIHERLNMAGVPISYRRLRVYRGRIERRKRENARPELQIVAAAPRVTERPNQQSGSRAAPAFDPLANLRDHEQKRMDWQYPSGPPDESKLI